MATRMATVAFGAGMLVLTVAFYAFPAWHLVLWSSLALSSAGAIATGVLIHRPPHPFAWWLLALAVTVFAAGDTTYNVLTTILGRQHPYPSLADVFYLAMYPVAAAGLVLLIRWRTGGRDRGSLLDALSVTTALGLLSWIFLIDPYVQDHGLTWLERATSIAYPLGDILILATLARLLLTTGRNRAAAMLGVGAVGLLGSDVVYGLGQLAGTWAIGSWYDLGWVVFYIGWGLAALRPQMVELTVPVPAPSSEMTIGRIALLMAVSLVAPGVLLADSVTGDVPHGPIIATSSALLFLLVLARLAGVVTRHRQAVERERTLRSAGDDLVSAADGSEVAAAVRTAVARLLPVGVPHRAVLLTDGETTGVPGADTPDRASRLLSVDAVEGVAARELSGFTTALSCPLVLADRPTTGPSVGLLLVAADESVLVTLRGALEVLASQAALAVERIDAEPRDHPAQQRGVLPHARAERPRRHPDRGRRRPASGTPARRRRRCSARGRSSGRPSSTSSRRTTATPPSAPCGRCGRGCAPPAAAATGSCAADGASRRRRGHLPRPARRPDRRRASCSPCATSPTQRQLERELTHRAFHDSLTGLANRVLFRDRVEQALAATRRRRAAWSASSSSTWTTSRWSTTRWATAPATSCWSPSPPRLTSRPAHRRHRGPAGRRRVRRPHRGRRRPPRRSRRSRRGSSTASPAPSTSPAG